MKFRSLKTKISLVTKLVALCLMFVSFGQKAFSQAQVTMAFEWVPSAQTSTTADFDVRLTNSGTLPLTFNGVIIRGNHTINTTILTGGVGTVSWNWVTGSTPTASSGNTWSNWPNNTANLPYTASTRLLNYSSPNAFFTSATAPTIPSGSGVVIGRFRVSVTGGTFASGAQFGFVWATTCATIAYVNGAGTTTSLATAGTNKIVSVSASQPLGPVASGPTASVLASGTGSSSYCNPGSANIKVTITGGTGPYTVWANGSTTPIATSYTSAADIAVSPTTTTTYTLDSVKDAGGNKSTGLSGSATVTVNQPDVHTPQTESACGSYTWPVNGQTYTSSNTYTATYTNQYGCDSSYTLNLTINNADVHAPQSASACGSYTWPVNGQTYTSSNTYTATYTNQYGCDSSYTLNLTITTPTNNTTNASACTSYTWSVNSQTYYASGTYVETSGCTTETLNLTIGNNTIALATSGNTGSTVGTNVCGTNTQLAASTMLYANLDCSPIATINSIDPLGSTTACANVLSGALPVMANAQTFGKRWYSVTPTTAGTGSITLYYTQADFNSYNISNGVNDMPSSGSNTDPNIGNMRIAQIENGVLSLANTYPAILNWNATANRWEATFTPTSITTGGQYYFYGEPGCALLVDGTTISATPSSTSAVINWTAVSGTTGYVVRWRVNGTTTWTSGTVSTNSITLPTLNSLTTYDVQVRTICNSSWGLASTINTFTTLGALPTCSTPTMLPATAVTGTGATLNWQASATPAQNVNMYYVRWKPSTGSTWSAAYTSSLTRVLNLPASATATQYDAQVMLFCTGTATSTSAWSSVINFTTPGVVILPSCDAPTGLAASGVTATSATLSWLAPVSGNVNTYLLQWKSQSATSWTQCYTTALTRNLTNILVANTTYDSRVATHCTSGTTATSSSTYSPIVTFTTSTLRENNTPSIATNAINVYPNPTSGELNIEATFANNAIATVKVMDMSGRVVKQVQTNTIEGLNNIQISLSDLTSGIYTIQLYNNDKLTNVSRVSKKTR